MPHSHDFFRWLLNQKNRFWTIVVVILGGLTSAVALVTKFIDSIRSILPESLSLDMLADWNMYLHLVVTGLIVMLVRSRLKGKKGIHEAVIQLQATGSLGPVSPAEDVTAKVVVAVNEFLMCWRLFWVALFGLYGFWLFQRVMEIPDSEGWPIVVSVALNNAGSLFLILCYRSLARQTVLTVEEADGTTHYQQEPVLPIVVGYLVLTIVHAVLAGLNSAIDPVQSPVTSLFMILSGLLFAIAVALVAGRLDSKAIVTQRWFVVLFYTYAAIQPLFTLFPSLLGEKVIVLYAGLLLKTFFFLYVSWLISSGRLIFYFITIPRIHSEMETLWSRVGPKLRF